MFRAIRPPDGIHMDNAPQALLEAFVERGTLPPRPRPTSILYDNYSPEALQECRLMLAIAARRADVKMGLLIQAYSFDRRIPAAINELHTACTAELARVLYELELLSSGVLRTALDDDLIGWPDIQLIMKELDIHNNIIERVDATWEQIRTTQANTWERLGPQDIAMREAYSRRERGYASCGPACMGIFNFVFLTLGFALVGVIIRGLGWV